MKLLTAYYCFSALELLEPSIKNTLEATNDILLCWQNESYRGKPNKEVEPEVNRLQLKYGLQKLQYLPNPGICSKENERLKYQQIIDYAIAKGYTHLLIMAEDHFYEWADFVHAVTLIKKYGYTRTATKMFTYYKSPNYQITPIEDYFCPFICQIEKNTKVTRNPVNIHTDPSLRLEGGNYKELPIMLHHYSMVRNDIELKLMTAAAGHSKEKIERYLEEYKNYKVGQPISLFKNRYTIFVPSSFSLS